MTAAQWLTQGEYHHYPFQRASGSGSSLCSQRYHLGSGLLHPWRTAPGISSVLSSLCRLHLLVSLPSPSSFLFPSTPPSSLSILFSSPPSSSPPLFLFSFPSSPLPHPPSPLFFPPPLPSPCSFPSSPLLPHPSPLPPSPSPLLLFFQNLDIVYWCRLPYKGQKEKLRSSYIKTFAAYIWWLWVCRNSSLECLWSSEAERQRKWFLIQSNLSFHIIQIN